MRIILDILPQGLLLTCRPVSALPSADVTLREQFHTLYSDHHRWLLAWLRRKLGCPEQAADVAHNTFLRILSARQAIAGVEQPRAWLATTARRLIIDDTRHRQVEQRYLAELSLHAEQADGYPSPEEILAAVQALSQLGEVLAAVSEKARHAFVRHYLDGEPHAVVAAELSVSVRMVRKYLSQVLLRASQLGLDPG